MLPFYTACPPPARIGSGYHDVVFGHDIVTQYDDTRHGKQGVDLHPQGAEKDVFPQSNRKQRKP